MFAPLIYGIIFWAAVPTGMTGEARGGWLSTRKVGAAGKTRYAVCSPPRAVFSPSLPVRRNTGGTAVSRLDSFA